MWTYLIGSISFISILVWAQNRKKELPKILGIYAQPGRWYYLKYSMFFVLLKTRRLFKKRGDLSDIEKWDKLQQLSSDNKAFDAVFFQGVTREGYYLATGVERRQNGKANALIYLMVTR